MWKLNDDCIYYSFISNSGESFWTINLSFKEKGLKNLWNKVIQVGQSTLPNEISIGKPHCVSQKYFKNFLKSLSYSSYKRFTMYEGGLLKRISPYVPDLDRILPKCQNVIVFENFIFTQRDFKHIIYNCFNWEIVAINFWKLDFEDITITCKAKSKIKKLGFWESGSKSNSNWEEHPQRFFNLMKAISESSIKESLQSINIGNGGITEGSYSPYLNFYGILSIIKIWSENSSVFLIFEKVFNYFL